MKPPIAHAALPQPGTMPPPVNVASAVVRAAIVDVQDDVLMALSDFSARTGLRVVSITIGHDTRTVRNPLAKQTQVIHDYQLNICVRLPQ